MNKNDLQSKAIYVEDVVPSFLEPGHIISQNQLNTQQETNIIDLLDHDFMRPQEQENTSAINDFVIRESLHQALERQHIDLFMQPIVTIPQRHTTFYELFGRLRVNPGQYLPAQDYLKVANEEHIVNRLDTLFLNNCFNVLRKQYGKHPEPLCYFLNIRPYTLRDRNFMGTLLRLFERNPSITPMIILEMRYHDFLTLSPGENKILAGLAQLGCRFSVDHTDGIPTDIKFLRDRNIQYVKVDARIILRNGKTESGFSDVLTKKRNLDVNGITMIVEKIEKESELLEILDFDIRYGQGFLFGRPDFQGVYTNYSHTG